MDACVLIAALSAGCPAAAPHVVDSVAAAVETASSKHGVDPLLLAAVVAHESGCRVHVVSRHRNGCDVGLAQINVRDCDPRAVRALRDPAGNLDAAAKLLARRRRLCRSGLWPRWACSPHHVQSYNARSRGYATRVLGVRRRIVEAANEMCWEPTRRRR